MMSCERQTLGSWSCACWPARQIPSWASGCGNYTELPPCMWMGPNLLRIGLLVWIARLRFLAVNADRLIPDLHRIIANQTSFDRGPLTQAQQGVIPHAVAAATSGRSPDALFVHELGEDVLYAIHWTAGSVYGVLNVMNIDPDYSGPPTTEGWVRPISEISRVDLRVDVQRDRIVVSDLDVRLDATLNWRDGGAPVRVDGTFSGDHRARDAAIALIKSVLAKVGAELT